MVTWWMNFLRREYERGDVDLTEFKGKIMSNANVATEGCAEVLWRNSKGYSPYVIKVGHSIFGI